MSWKRKDGVIISGVGISGGSRVFIEAHRRRRKNGVGGVGEGQSSRMRHALLEAVFHVGLPYLCDLQSIKHKVLSAYAMVCMLVYHIDTSGFKCFLRCSDLYTSLPC